ncbi:hypothetical protein [Streptomyces hirsutus]|uniref:hypothetical protein n=1 Tax=Streptomyces hirsutus TaxID=35620 RepID=UPI0036C00268
MSNPFLSAWLTRGTREVAAGSWASVQRAVPGREFLMTYKFLSVVVRHGDVSAVGIGFLLFSVLWWGFRVVTRMPI